MDEQKLLLRCSEAAKLLSLSRAKVYEMAAARELPVVHVGRAVRIPAQALRRWIDERGREQFVD